MTNTYAIVLAAGQGTRMKSDLYKVLHPVCGKSMVAHVIDNIRNLGAERIVTIVGHGAEKVEETLGKKSEYALQKEQLGTAHAVQQAENLLGNLEGTTIVVCGDTPLIRSETMAALIAHHNDSGAKATILTAIADDPTGYGRVIRGDDGQVLRNVEHKDATKEEQKVVEINTGTYCFDNKVLFETLKKVNNDNAQGEYYLPDVIGILQAEGALVSAHVTDDFSETLGINDRVVLSEAERVMRHRLAEKHMRNGVTIIDPNNTYIESEVVIGSDTIVEAGVSLKGQTVIGQECFIGSNSEIVDSTIGNFVKVTSSMIEQSQMADYSNIGPYSHIRPNSTIGEAVHIGNFVEVKNAVVGKDTKVGHLTYVGDADLGENINVGCGTVFVNYDGAKKHRSTVGDNSFIGCNVNIIAPVDVAKNAFLAAGSTITKDVPEGALGIARSRQENKKGYWEKLPASNNQKG